MPKLPRQMPLDLQPRAGYAPEDFRMSDCNRAAAGWIERWPDWGGPLLIVHGPAGSGKTHLGEVWRARSKAVAGDPAKIADLRAGDIPAFFLDDADRNFIGRREEEEVLFHLYNYAATRNRHILLTAAAPPQEWNIVLPDLKSRLLAAPAVGIGPPDDALMAVVLAKLFSDRQVTVPPEVLSFLLPRIERSFGAARALADRIDRRALAEQRPVTVPFVRALLQEEAGN
jgi:chromosomal replication initiation ATPase DnaA